MTRAERILSRVLERTVTKRQQEALEAISECSGLTVEALGRALSTTTRNAHNFGNLMATRGYARMEIAPRRGQRSSRAYITGDGLLVLRLLQGGPQ